MQIQWRWLLLSRTVERSGAWRVGGVAAAAAVAALEESLATEINDKRDNQKDHKERKKDGHDVRRGAARTLGGLEVLDGRAEMRTTSIAVEAQIDNKVIEGREILGIARHEAGNRAIDIDAQRRRAGLDPFAKVKNGTHKRFLIELTKRFVNVSTIGHVAARAVRG